MSEYLPRCDGAGVAQHSVAHVWVQLGEDRAEWVTPLDVAFALAVKRIL
ncbi:MAG: hypothetical protein ACOYEV_07445 [Candidatus Nanopelagicales bacterium]